MKQIFKVTKKFVSSLFCFQKSHFWQCRHFIFIFLKALQNKKKVEEDSLSFSVSSLLQLTSSKFIYTYIFKNRSLKKLFSFFGLFFFLKIYGEFAANDAIFSIFFLFFSLRNKKKHGRFLNKKRERKFHPPKKCRNVLFCKKNGRKKIFMQKKIVLSISSFFLMLLFALM